LGGEGESQEGEESHHDQYTPWGVGSGCWRKGTVYNKRHAVFPE
jgi:hypothetical protein